MTPLQAPGWWVTLRAFGSPRRLRRTWRWLIGLAVALHRRRAEPRLTVAVDVDALYEALTGVGWYLHQLLTHLAQRDDLRLRLYDQSLVGGDPGTAAPTSAPPQGPAIERVCYDAPDGLVVPPWRARQWLRRLAPWLVAADGNDVVFAPNYLAPPLLGRAAGAQVAMIHDLTVRRLPATARPDTAAELAERLDRVLLEAHLLLTPSAAVRDELRAVGIAPPRVRAIHHGPGHLADQPEQAPPPEAPPSYGLYVGTLEPRKNLRTLLAAWRLLRCRHSGAPPLVLCGRWGWQSGELARDCAAARAEGWLVELGYVAAGTLAALYRNARVVVLPSWYEGFGLPALEAMHAGRPLVLSDLPVLREVAGEAALYASPHDPAAWASALARLLDDPRLGAELGERGRRRAAAFTWERSAAAHIEAWQLAAARATASRAWRRRA